MSLALVAALALSPTAAAAHCSWDNPGADPFMGNVPAAVDRYTDIPADVRARLKARMAQRQFDEMATIRRDSITGRYRYSAEIRDMHFGQGRVCRSVSRTKWAPDAVERGLVYCEAEHCIIVPTVCRNVSRVQRLPGLGAEAPGGTGGLPGLLAGPAAPGMGTAPDGSARPLAANDPTNTGDLVFDPPGAGNPSFSQASAALPALPLAAAGLGAGAGGVPLSGPLGAIPGVGGGDPGTTGGGGPLLGGGGGGGGIGGGSALDPPTGVLPIGGGSVGGGGIPGAPPVVPPIDVPEVLNPPPVPDIPEPATWALWLAGLLGLRWLVRRRRQA